MLRSLPSVLVPITVSLALVAISCAPQAEQEADPVSPAARRVESPEMGIALARLPKEFEVVSTEGEEIRLTARKSFPQGTVSIAIGPEQRAGVDLTEAVRQQKAHIESLPEGDYRGNVELGSPIGTAYTTRGRYLDDEERIEEIRLFAVHPTANRLLWVKYTYPAGGDTKTRMDQAMEILGELEALPAGDGAGSSGAP